MTRTLRSGKPLPDPPPVMRNRPGGSTAPATPADSTPEFTTISPKEAATPKGSGAGNIKSQEATLSTPVRRSLRCPKPKPAPTLEATIAVERDAAPMEECLICGDKFKKHLLARHIKHCKAKSEALQLQRPQTPHETNLREELQVKNVPKEGRGFDESMEQEFEDGYYSSMSNSENGARARRAVIDFTRKRPSLSSLALKNPVRCNVCGMTFTRRAHLNRHMLLHTGDKPFQCDVCKIKFTRKDHMLAHRQKHKEDHKVECVQCGTGFQSWKILQEHIRTAHTTLTVQTELTVEDIAGPVTPTNQESRASSSSAGESPTNTCEICGKEFRQKRYLRAHRKLHVRKEALLIAQLRQAEEQFGYEDEDELLKDVDVDKNNSFQEDEDEMMLRPEVKIESNDEACLDPNLFDEHEHLEPELLEQPEPVQPKLTPKASPSSFSSESKQSPNVQEIKPTPCETQVEVHASSDINSNINSVDGLIISNNSTTPTPTPIQPKKPRKSLKDKKKKSLISRNRVIKLSTDIAEKSSSDGSEVSKNSSLTTATTVEEANLEEDDLQDLIDYDCKAMMQLKAGNFDDTYEDADFPQILECSVCGKEFGERSDLRRHYRIHKKQFICRFCGLQLASAGSLMRHNLTHTGRKEFTCKLCKRKFSRKDTLMVHLQAHEKSSTRINMPKPFVCKVCSASYTMKYNLIRHIKISHGGSTSVNRANMLKQIELKYKNGIPDNAAPEQTQVDTHTTTKESASEAQDEGYSLNDSENFQTDFKEEVKEEEELEITMNEEEIIEPMVEIKEEPSSVEDGELLPDEMFASEGFHCGHCGKIFKNAKSLNTHKWYHSRQKHFICPICNRGFKYSTDLSRHVNTHANDKSTFSAPSTPQPQTSRRKAPPENKIVPKPVVQIQKITQIQDLQFQVQAARKFACKLCPQRFNHRSNLSRHVRLIHKATAPRKRNYAFVHQNYMQTVNGERNRGYAGPHEDTVSIIPVIEQAPPKPRSPNLLGAFANSELQVTPKKLDPAERRNSAVLTPDSFTYDPTAERPYTCNACGKTFENKNNLWTHCRIHDKRFGCDFCGLKMATRGDWILHLRTHTGEKPFGCDLCEWRFSRKSGLNKHMDKYHGPGAKQLRAWKPVNPNPTSPSGSLKLKIHANPNSNGYYIKKTQNEDDIGMEVSPVPNSNSNSSEKRHSSREILKSALQNGEPTHVITTNGVTITRTSIGTNSPKLSKLPKPALVTVDKYRCSLEFCHATFPKEIDYIRHMEEHRIQRALSAAMIKNEAEPQGKQKQFICLECGEEYPSQELLTKHIRTHSDSDIPRCTLCGKSCSSLGFLKRHYQYVHPDHPNPGDRVRPVSQLLKRKADDSPDPASFLEQSMGVSNVENSEDYNCVICNKKFPTRQKWLYHRYYHIREEKYDCPECPEKFKLRSHLARHISTYHNEEKPVYNILMCDKCPRKFTREYDLITHFQKVHVQIPQAIQKQRLSMPATVTASSKLKNLPMLLSNQLPKSSITVSKVVGPRSSWPPIKHLPITMVKQEKPGAPSSVEVTPDGLYICRLCGKKFKEKKSIDAHRYYHNREEKHFCGACGAKFKQKSDLSRHVRIHHSSSTPKDTIHCPHCFRSFTDIRYMRMHIRRYHSLGSQNQGGSGKTQKRLGQIPRVDAGVVEAMGIEVDNPSEYLDDDIDEMDWTHDDFDEDQKNMEEIEYSQYEEAQEAVDEENEDDTGAGTGLQLTITCEGCGVEVEAEAISNHTCSPSSSHSNENNSPSGESTKSKLKREMKNCVDGSETAESHTNLVLSDYEAEEREEKEAST